MSEEDVTEKDEIIDELDELIKDDTEDEGDVTEPEPGDGEEEATGQYCGPNSEVCINSDEVLADKQSKDLDSSENITLVRAALCIEQAETANANLLDQLDY